MHRLENHGITVSRSRLLYRIVPRFPIFCTRHCKGLFRAVQGGRRHAETLEVGQQVRFQPFQTGFRLREAVGFDPEGQVLRLGQAVAPLRHLIPEHPCVFLPDGIELVPGRGNVDLPGDAFLRGGDVHKGELDRHGRIEVVEKVAPPLEHGGFVLVLGQLIVDVLKAHRLHIPGFADPADPVRVHSPVRDAVLRRQDFLFIRQRAGFQIGQLFFLLS